jgi:hypothetical protein
MDGAVGVASVTELKPSAGSMFVDMSVLCASYPDSRPDPSKDFSNFPGWVIDRARASRSTMPTPKKSAIMRLQKELKALIKVNAAL